MRLARADARAHALIMTKSLTRIVLSALALCAVLTACSTAPLPATEADDIALVDVEPADGIGTSPSDPFEVVTCPAPVYPCGVWVDSSADAADARSLACSPADVIVYSGEHVTCVDALTMTTGLPRFVGTSFVRRVDARGRALEARCP